jgi:hypothetical protein
MGVRVALGRVFVVLPFLAAMVGMAVGDYLLIAGSMPERADPDVWSFPPHPLGDVLAAVVVAAEAGAGVLMMEAAGITHIFPRLARLPRVSRIGIATSALLLLLTMTATGCLAVHIGPLSARMPEAYARVSRPLLLVLSAMSSVLLMFTALPLQTLLDLARSIWRRARQT